MELKPCPFCGDRLSHEGSPPFDGYLHANNGCFLYGTFICEPHIHEWNTRTPADNSELVTAANETIAAIDDGNEMDVLRARDRMSDILSRLRALANTQEDK